MLVMDFILLDCLNRKGGGEQRSHSLHVVELVRYTSLLGLKCHAPLNVGLYSQDGLRFLRPKA